MTMTTQKVMVADHPTTLTDSTERIPAKLRLRERRRSENLHTGIQPLRRPLVSRYAGRLADISLL